MFSNMSSPEKNTQQAASLPIARKHLDLVVPPMTPSSKKGNGGGDRFIDKALFMDDRKLSSMTVPVAMPIPKTHSNHGEHMLIPDTVKLIHSKKGGKCNRFVLRDGRLLHMVKLVGAVRAYHVNTKNIMIDVDDGTGLV